MPRRGKGEGSIVRRKDGRWAAFVTVGYGADGRQIKRWVYGKTRREVAEKLAKLLPKAGSGIIRDPARLTVGDWIQRFAESRAREVRPTTAIHYPKYIRYLEPIHRIRLLHLQPVQIKAAYDALAERGLSPSVRRHTHHFLKGALREAVKLGLIEKNPADMVDPPSLKPVRPPRAWRAKEATRFLEVARRESRYYPLFALMLGLGLRVGEALALRWEDWEEERLHVRHTMNLRTGELGPPKTPNSVRTLYLAPEFQVMLAKHREKQRLEAAAAKRWVDHGLIFPSRVGSPTSYRNLMRHFRALADKAGVPAINLHGLRHTYTTQALRVLPPKVVAEVLGHADVQLTLQVYQQLQEEDKKRAAVGLSKLLQPDTLR